MNMITLILDTPVSRKEIEEKAKSATTTIQVSGHTPDGAIMTGVISFTGTSKVTDRGWSEYYTDDSGTEYYTGSNQWEDGYCKVIDLI